MKITKSGIVDELKEKYKERLTQAQQDLKGVWQGREGAAIVVIRIGPATIAEPKPPASPA
ncbi:MAG TPA: hypothetical protein VGY98_09340 [Verrucomicrobiae bacterium]|nr:hypothetical protein [Verrucomicrobiae bacterium]